MYILYTMFFQWYVLGCETGVIQQRSCGVADAVRRCLLLKALQHNLNLCFDNQSHRVALP